MAEPARKIYDDEGDDKSLSAQERADLRWGLEHPPEELPDEESEDKSARDKANERWGMSPDEVKEAEENADSAESTSADKKESDEIEDDNQIGEGYNPDDKKGRTRQLIGRFSGLSTRKKAAGGGIIGIIIASILGLSTIVTGPLQFIHIAQLLQRFHFASAQDDGNSRILKLYKWSKNAKAGTVENTRLGFIGKRVAIKIDAQLAEIGIKKNYLKGGTYDGTTIDAHTFSENSADGDIFKGLEGNPDAFMTKFEETYGVKLTRDGSNLGSFKVDEDGMFAFLKNRRLNKMLVQQAGYDNMAGTVSARIMGARDKVPWHPIQKADTKITGALDKQFSAWLDKLKEKISNGDTQAATANGETAKDKKGNVDQGTTDNNNSGASDTNSSAESAKKIVDGEAGGETNLDAAGSKYIQQFTEHLGTKVALSATAVIGLACAAQGIAHASDNLKHDMVVLPLIRMGMQAISLGNQVMSGQDLDTTQLGFYYKQLNDPKSGSWANAKSIQAELGQDQTGPDMPNAYNPSKIGKNMFSQITDVIPGLNAICSAVNSTLGGLAMTVVGLVTAPVGTVSQEIISRSGVLTGPISSLVRWMAGSPIPTFVGGPAFGNFINYGSRLAANDQFASMGGAKLSNTQAAEIRNYNIAAQKQDFENQSIAKRVFDPYSPDSLVGKAIDSTSPNINSNVASVLASVSNPLRILAVLKMPFSQKVSAAESNNYDYGFQEVGFSLGDLNSPAYDNPYDNANKAISLLRASDDTYRNRIKDCFGVTFDPNSTDGALTTEFTSIDVLKDGYDKKGCADPSSNWTSIRVYVLDMKTAEATDCFESGDNQSCQNSGFGSQAATDNVPTGTVGSVAGYKRPLRDVQELTPERIDQGVDYAGTGPVYAIGNGTVIDANTHAGWPGGNWVSYQLEDGAAAGKVVFVAEDCTVNVSAGQHVTPDTVICNMFKGKDGVETGWAESGLSERALGHPEYTCDNSNGSISTSYGLNFSKLLGSLGDPPGVVQVSGKNTSCAGSPSTTPLPAGWPTW